MNSLLKFDGPNLEELLARVQRELGPQVTILEANRVRKGGVGGFFAREWFEVVVEGDIEGDIESDVEAVASASAAAVAVDPFLAMASAVDDVHEGSRSVTAAVAERHVSAFDLVLAGAQRANTLGGAVPALQSAPVPELQPAPAPHRVVPAPAARRMRDLALPELLGHLDAMVPDQFLPAGHAPVVAVVGDPNQVRQVAAAVAGQLGLSESDVVVAGPEPKDVSPWLALTDPRAARSRASRWREADHPTVVAIELSPGADGHAWAAAMLTALAADQVRLVAKAWQLTDQLATKALALGGIDGIDLVEMDAAAEPELFLELDQAVLGIDGRPATAELWAALMYERRTDERHQ